MDDLHISRESLKNKILNESDLPVKVEYPEDITKILDENFKLRNAIEIFRRLAFLPKKSTIEEIVHHYQYVLKPGSEITQLINENKSLKIE